MRTLAKKTCFVEIDARLRRVQAWDIAQWGVMNAQEMICHLRGAFRMAMGEIVPSPMAVRIPKPVTKFAALRMPIPWLKNFKTVPVLERGTSVMQVTTFSTDHAEVTEELRRFCLSDQHRVAHPFLGPMSFEDWMRWGYLHTDHHLRQFGR